MEMPDANSPPAIAARSYAPPVQDPRLDLRSPAVATLLRDSRTMSIWEMIRRFGRAVTVAELAKACELPVSAVTEAVGRLEVGGLVRRADVRRGTRRGGYRALGDKIVIEIDPEAPVEMALLHGLAADFERESRTHIDQSLADSRRGVDRHCRKHAYAYLALSREEAMELLALFGPIDAFVARMLSKSPDPQGPAPELCNHLLALHIAPISTRQLPRARLLFTKRGHSPEIKARLQPDPITRLSEREREVASLLASGMTMAAVAKRLGLKSSTVETLTSRLYRKLGIRKRIELASKIKGH